MLNSKELQDWMEHEREDMKREHESAAAVEPEPPVAVPSAEPEGRPLPEASDPAPSATVVDTVPEPDRYAASGAGTSIRHWLLIAALLLAGLIGYSLLAG